MNQILESKQDWDDLAEINAAWFNVPKENLPDHNWEIESFFEGGKAYVKRAMELINKHGLILPRHAALDFGCGIGRVAQALTEEFNVVYGIDISEKMIEIAMQYNQYGDKCIYIANASSDLKILQDGSISFIFSNNALQHNHPDIIKSYLLEFIRILTANGVMLFQIPIDRFTQDEKAIKIRQLPKIHPKRVWNKLKGILIGHDGESRYYKLRKLGFSKKWLFEKWGLRPHINMYFLEETILRDLLESYGCEIKNVEKYQYQDMIHAQFLVLKPG